MKKNSARQDPASLKAIPTDGVCLKCHGKELPNELTTIISELYPDDRTTGFSVGDIRGAFVVVEKLN